MNLLGKKSPPPNGFTGKFHQYSRISTGLSQSFQKKKKNLKRKEQILTHPLIYCYQIQISGNPDTAGKENCRPISLINISTGQPRWLSGLVLPSAQGLILETWESHLGLPAWSLLLPLPVSLPLSVSVSLSVCLMNKRIKSLIINNK